MILRVARTRLAFRMLIILVFLVGPTFLLTAPPYGLKILGGIAALWAVMALAGLTFRITGPEPIIVIDELGIEDLRSGLGKIPWRDIASLEIRSHLGEEFLYIETARADWYLGDGVPMSTVTRNSTNTSALWMSLKGVSPSASRVRSYLTKNHGAIMGGGALPNHSLELPGLAVVSSDHPCD